MISVPSLPIIELTIQLDPFHTPPATFPATWQLPTTFQILWSIPILLLWSALLPGAEACFRLESVQANDFPWDMIGWDLHVQCLTRVAKVLSRKHRDLLTDQQGCREGVTSLKHLLARGP